MAAVQAAVPKARKPSQGQKEERINVRVDASSKERIDAAARRRGVDRSKFMLESTLAAAREVLLDQTSIELSAQAWDKFVAELDAPPKPTRELVALLSREPVWSKR